MRASAAVLAAAIALGPAWAHAQSPEAKSAYNEGLRFKTAKDDDAALKSFLRATELDPSFAAAWTEVGNSQLGLDRAPAAAKSFSRALQLEPADLTARYNLAYTLRQLGRYQEAAEQYRRYLEQKPDDADAHYGLAESLKAAGDLRGAADAFEAYAKSEKRPTWKQWVAKARAEAASLREQAAKQAPEAAGSPAVAAAQPKAKAPEAKPSPPTAAATPAKTSGLHLSFSNQAPAAEAPEDGAPMAAAAGPVRSSARPEAFEAGLTRLRAGDYPAALARLKVARAEAPEDAVVLAALAGAHLGLLQGKEAADTYRVAMRSAAPGAMAALHFGLAEALRLQGDDAGARAQFSRAAEHEQSPPALQKIARERIALLSE